MSARRAPQHALPAQRFVPGGAVPHPRKSGTLPHVPVEDALAFGADLLDAGFCWEAHEVWEGLWTALGRTTDDARAVQALIKIAAAGVKRLMGEPEGERRHLAGAAAILDELGGWPGALALSVDVRALRAAVGDGSVLDDGVPWRDAAT